MRQKPIDVAMENFVRNRFFKKLAKKKDGGIPMRTAIGKAKNLEELQFFIEACKRGYPNASPKTQKKWLKALNAKLVELGQKELDTLNG